MVTYILEDDKSNLIGYYKTLGEAKRCANECGLPIKDLIIRKFLGHNFGEGSHIYTLKRHEHYNSWKYFYKLGYKRKLVKI